MTTIDLNPDIQEYLEQAKRRSQLLSDPSFIAQQQAGNNIDFDANLANNQGAAYSKAFAQLGTLGGKAADTSSVSDNAKAIAQNLGQQRQQNMQDQAERDSATGLRGDILKHLNDVQNKNALANMTDQRDRDLADQQDQRAYNLASMTADRMSQIEKMKDDRALQLMDMRGDMMSQNASNKGDQTTDKRFTEFGKALNEGLASSRSDLGKQQGLYSAGDRVLQLGEQAKSQAGGLDARQMHELAIASANLVSGGGTGAAQSTIEALAPKTAQGSAAALEEWLTSEPQGAQQQAFVDRMLETANREKHLAGEKIKSIKSGVLQSYSDLKDKNPDRYNQFINSNFGEKPQFDPSGKYVMQGYQMPQAPGQGTSGTAYAASPAAPAPTPPGMVRVISPEGATGTISIDKLEAAKARGFKEAQ